MADITITNSPAGYDLADFSLTILIDYFYWQHTATSTVFTSDPTNDGTGFDPSVTGVSRLEVLGTGLTDALSPTFVYTAGTINSFNFLTDGVKLFSATNLNLSAVAITEALIEALGSGGAIDNTLSLILQNADKITGGIGGDTISGFAQNDTLLGGAGNDSLLGGDGADRINGQKGIDSLTGGDGADIFVFDSKLKTGVDTISDFNVNEDRIHLDNAIFTKAGRLGTLKFGAFVEGTKAKDAGDRIIYDEATGKILYDADGNGKSKAVLFAQVEIGTDLTNGQFLII